jgi:Putative Flp pilus-assembly TadE/G-like
MTRQNEAGQALIFGVVTLGLLLLGFAGLGIDMGYLRYEKRLEQSAADGAALAAVASSRYSSTDINGSAQNAASINGFTVTSVSTGCPPPAPATAVGSVAVTVNAPPCSGPHSGAAGYVEAYVAKVHPTFFMRVLGVQTETVTARAVAYWGAGNANSCIFTLGNPGNGIQGVTVNGTPTLNAPTCGIDDNGDFRTNGKKLDVNAGSIGVVGSDSNNGGGTVTPTPITGIAPADDPLGYLTPPAVGTPINFNPANIVPGSTYSSISITGGNVNFPSGTYIVNGNMTINGNANVTATGVTFYITNGGSVTINGTGTVTFSAPTTGTYAGILFYQDPSDSSKATINGTSTSSFTGALYFPKASLDFSGTAGSTSFNSGASYTVIVSDALTVSGTATVNINSDFSSLPGGNPIYTSTLVE